MQARWKIGRVLLELVSGEEVSVPYTAWEAALDRNVTLATPAPSGAKLILEDHSEETIQLSSAVIVAFVLTARGEVRALTSH